MPAAAASRAELDVAELNLPDTTPVLPGQPTDTYEPPEPLENGKPRRWAEFCLAATGAIFIGLLMVPYQLKKGQAWFTAAQSLVLASAVLSVVCLFWGNTHIKMIRFLSGKGIFIQVSFLTLLDFLRAVIMPDHGWEESTRIGGATVLVLRLSFICLDSLKGMSRWFRLFGAFFFMFGNFWGVFKVYFLDSEQTLYTIGATNTTITNSAVKAGVGTTIVTLTASMLVTIWQDKDFQYSALFRSYLPKLAVETAGVEPGSAEMDLILEERAASAVAWKGWPRKSALVVMVSILVYGASIVMSVTELAYDDDGNESLAMIVMRVLPLALGCGGSCAFFPNNVSWRRLIYVFSSTEGILWLFYTLVFALSGLAVPTNSPISSALGTVYTALGLIAWISLESVQQISRLMHMTITFITALTLVVSIYLSAYVWQDDAVLADLNGVGVPGILTRFALLRTCFINMLLLMVGALSVSVGKSLPDGSYFVLLTGNVMRRQILEAESLGDDPDGDNDFIVQNFLLCVEHVEMEHRVSRHSLLSVEPEGKN